MDEAKKSDEPMALPLADAVVGAVAANQAARQTGAMLEVRSRALARTYLGQPCRIARAFRRSDGVQMYALKTMTACLALAADKGALIDLAEAHYLMLTDIAD